MQKIEEDCECVPSYYEETAPDVKICTGPSINCMNQLKDKIGSIKFIKDNGYYRDEPMKFITNKGWYCNVFSTIYFVIKVKDQY